jgi:ABC-type glycerol-3-phosphate transport system substrate-binding protein
MRTLAALVIALSLVAAGCGGSSSSTRKTAGLTNLQSVDQLQKLFVEHAGEPRLILLMSPT